MVIVENKEDAPKDRLHKALIHLKAIHQIETLQQIVLKSHLKIKRLIKGTHYDYLAQIEE